MKKLIFISFLSFHFSHFSVGQTRLSQKEWVDSVYDCMSLEQKIGQLFMVAAYSNKNEHHFRHLDSLITHCHLGGLIFFQGGPLRQAKLTNRYQALAKIPLWIGMDAEWGLGMRLDSTLSFPKQMTLGALQDNSLIYKMGKQLAYQCRRLGVHISFSPVMDVNSNPDNPVIGVRSFGEDKEKVAMKGIAYMRGLQDNKVLACAKHFPGHGDTDTDSHLSLPIIKQDKKRIESLELYPFKRLIKDSIGSIMIAHINTPAYEEEENLAATLSHNIVNDLLKEKLDFEGVIFTDALNMKAVSKFYKPGEVDLLAFKAGNDVLLFSENVPKAINLIKEAIEEKKNLRKELEKKVRKILMSKYWLKLYEKQHVKIDSLYEDLNNGNAHALRVKMYEEAFTIVRNKESLLPLKNGKSNQMASVAIGLDKENVFQKTLSKYAEFKNYVVDKKAMPDFDYRSLLDSLSKCNIVVVSLHELHNQRSKNYNISQNTIEFVQNLASKTKVVLVVMGNPYSLRNFENIDHLVCGYEDNFTTRRIAPQILFGALKANGTLPVSASATIMEGEGLMTESANLFRYSIPESVGMHSKKLAKIDTIATKAIHEKAMPGCQILIARNGTVVYNKNFGSLNYNPSDSVKDNTVYDLASITKVAATTLAVMHLYETKRLCLDSTIGYYLPELKGTNKEHLIVQEVLSHQAGLQAFLEHWKRTMVERLPNDYLYCNEQYCDFTIPVSSRFYANTFLPDSVWKWTIKSDLLPRKENNDCHSYVYSDIGFYIMRAICERILNEPIQDFLSQYFYEPLHLKHLGFNPLQRMPSLQVAPTEIDNYFRFQEIRGTVHDQGAAMLGGVAGHAGIFSNVQDLSILMQMLLNGGQYNGITFFEKETIREFTKAHYYYNRRGLGWDKPSLEKGGPTSDKASHNTFGHTGFTGTCVWMDPDKSLLYIFLSNRTYPTANNKKLLHQNVRTRIHDVAYDAMFDNTF